MCYLLADQPCKDTPGMVFGRNGRIDPETGEVLDDVIPVVPSHYKSPSDGQCMDLEDPSDWSFWEAENA